MPNIVIDKEFAAMIPALSAEERQQLEANIVEHGGARDPLVVWIVNEWRPGEELLLYDNAEVQKIFVDGVERYVRVWADEDGEDQWDDEDWPMVLLDGHNRYEICTRLGLPFEVHEMRLDSREEAEDWIDKNQLGRRNLTVDAFKLLLGRRYNRTKKSNEQRASDGGKARAAKDQIDLKQESTAAILGKEHGVSEATVKRAAKFAEEVEKTPELKAAIEDRRPVLQVKRELKEQAREQRREENRQKIASVPAPEQAATVSTARYATIVIDPPWDWGDEGDQDQLGRARPDYSTMSIDQLERLDVAALADDDCHIYLWITNRSLPKGFRLLDAWGFRYITAITWVKPHFGMGNYFRGQTEHVLFGVKGSQPLKRKDAGTAFMSDRGKGGHSSKPAAFLDFVESCSPGPYLEMFSRSQRDGWVTWGENAK